jgi:hypothetical protein
VSDFLSNLIARSLTDAPVIQPRVPSLFEPTTVELLDEPQSSMPASAAPETVGPGEVPARVRKLSRAAKTATAKSIANASDAFAEERPPKPGARGRQAARAIVSQETKQLIVPVTSDHGEEDHSGSTNQVSQRSSKTPAIQSFSRTYFSPVEQRPSTSPPIIRVTIGRVEVRAIHPPAPATKPAKTAPPKLSLEDYLHKRERGSR